MALIELDRDAPLASPPSRPPFRYFRWVVLAAVALLVLTLGGAATARAIRWQWAGLVPQTGAGTSFQLVGGVLYAIDGNDNRRTTTAWALHPRRKRWSRSDPLELDPSGTVIRDPGATLRLVGDDLLQVGPDRVTVLDPASGRVRWSSPVGLAARSGGTALVQQTDFAPGTEYDQSSGDPGLLYFSESGVPHTRPPDRTLLRALDLTTGAERWRLDEAGAVLAVPAGPAAYVVAAADGLSLVDANSGAVLRRHALPGRDVTYPDTAGNLLIMRQDPDQVTAFGLDTLDRLWRLTEPSVDVESGRCDDLACRRDARGIAVLNPRTGVPAWRVGTDVDLTRRGDDVLLTQDVTQTPLAVRDARTGALRAVLTGWSTLTSSAPGDPLVVFRAEPGTGRSIFGVLAPGARQVVTLGRSREIVRGLCSSNAAVIACRVDGGVELWSYRA